MNKSLILRQALLWILTAVLLVSAGALHGQNRDRSPSPALKTPLGPEVLELLAAEISGQIVFNNEVKLAGAPWLRDKSEFSETFYESGTLFRLAREYGIETVRLERWPSERDLIYPEMGELWTLEPKKRLIARLEADPALIARGSRDTDLTGKLVYIPPLSQETLEEWAGGGAPETYQGAVALMWSHAGQKEAKALDAAGVTGVISFSTRERYFDPDQVVYARGAYGEGEVLKFGLTVSWRQWSELLEDIERGAEIKVLCKVKLAKYRDKFENVYAWIPGSEPDRKGVIFSAHLFEGYTKRGANDNMSGCVVQLEILRALSRLIEQGALPRPRRTIAFLWPNEISGTYERIKRNPGFPESLSININMDMVGEGLRQNNAVFTLSECPNHLPSYLDGLTDSIMNYVWRTNDIVYLPDSPRGRRGGQYFPRPLWEKNGSRDAFRYSAHRATGGSDHICFNNPSVGVPGIELNVWPDQWYHADTDTPDKSDPTQMKRVAFIGAAVAWAAALCTDEVLPELLDKVSAYGYARIGERELPAALRLVDGADGESLTRALGDAFRLIDLAVAREIGAVESVEEIDTRSERALKLVDGHIRHWDLYRRGLMAQIVDFAAWKAEQIGVAVPARPAPGDDEKRYDAVVPALHPDVKGKLFYVNDGDAYKAHLKAHPDALKDIGLNRTRRRTIQNWIDGRRSVTLIRDRVMAETGKPLTFEVLIRYLDFLKTVGWIMMNEG